MSKLSPIAPLLESMSMRNTPETNAVIKGKPGDVLSLETRLIEKCADLECQRDELLSALKLVRDCTADRYCGEMPETVWDEVCEVIAKIEAK